MEGNVVCVHLVAVGDITNLIAPADLIGTFYGCKDLAYDVPMER